MKTLALLTVSALFCAAGTAHAQSRDSGPFYMGADVGYGNFDRDVDQESGSVSYGMRLGFDFSKYFALEAVYTDHGEYGSGDAIFCPGSCPGASFSPVDTKVRSHGINAVAKWPIGRRTRLKALVGYTQHKARMAEPALSQTLDGLALGVGLGTRIANKLDASVEFSTTVLSGEDLGTAWARHMDGNTSMVSMGLRWHF